MSKMYTDPNSILYNTPEAKKFRDQEAAGNAAVKSGGWVQTPEMTRRQGDMNAGLAYGQDLFYSNPDMQDMRARREDLAKGYSGQELGALRQTARGEIAGQRQSYLRQMASNLGRGGVGGARGAAMRGAADAKMAAGGAEAERKMALDSGNMVRQGTNDLQDFLMRQLYGKAGMGIGFGQQGSADAAAKMANAANQGGKK